MPDWVGKFFSTALQMLKGHQEAVLALSMCVIGLILYVAGAHPLLAFGLPVAIYLVYHFRMEAGARHKERMGELAVEKVEKALGQPAKSRAQKAIARRGGTTNGKHR